MRDVFYNTMFKSDTSTANRISWHNLPPLLRRFSVQEQHLTCASITLEFVCTAHVCWLQYMGPLENTVEAWGVCKCVLAVGP